MKNSILVLTTILFVVLVEASLLYINQVEWRMAESEPNTNHLEWATKWGGTGYDNAKSVALSDGSIYVAGTTRSYGKGLSDIFLLKYNNKGELAWNSTWGGLSYDGCWTTAADSEGIYVAGFTYTVGNQNANAVLLKYNSSGELLWSRTWGGSDDAVARGVVIDGKGAIYVAGYFRGTTTTTKSFLLKYHQDGNLIWGRTFGGEGVNAFAVGVSDGVYVDGTNETIEDNMYRSTMFMTKFDPSGSILWNRQWGNGPLNYCWSITVNGDNIYQAGTTSNNSSNSDAVLLSYDSSGKMRFNVTWGKTEEEYAWGVTWINNFIYITGHIYNESKLGFDSLLLKFTSDGTQIWNTTWRDKSVDVGHSVAIVGNDVYVTGISTDQSQNAQVFLLKYISANSVTSSIASLTAAVASAIGVVTLTAAVVKLLEHKSNPKKSEN